MMYLVTVLKQKIQTNAFPVNLNHDGIAGMVPVFYNKLEAEAYAKECNADVMEIEFVNPQPAHDKE